MRPTATEQNLADQCAKKHGHFFCANYIGRLTNEHFENAPVFSPSHDDSLIYVEGLPMIIVVSNDQATFFFYPLSVDYLHQMKEDKDYSKGRKIFKEYEQIVRNPSSVTKSDYQYIKEIVEVCNDLSYDRPIDKQTMYQFLEMADRFDMRIKILPIKETMDRCDGWEYYLKLVKKKIKTKTYRYDDAFKAKARAHQFEYREKVLNDFYEEKLPQVILSPDSARKGLIFCDVYRELIEQKVKKFSTSPRYSNMLRSEHIPYNIFLPMEEDKEHAKLLFNELIGGGISSVQHIIIEFPGYTKDKSQYLEDGTSFDAYIEYAMENGETGGIGIEVKYTENSYSICKDEKEHLEMTDSQYHKKSKKSGYFKPDFNIQSLIHADHLRQIWRNHLLGFAFVDRGDIQRFHHVHLYPKGNAHFHDYALPEYKELLTEKGLESFIPLTYERLFEMLDRYFTSDKQKSWIEYLRKRYIGF